VCVALVWNYLLCSTLHKKHHSVIWSLWKYCAIWNWYASDRCQTSAAMIPWWQWTLSDDWPKPLLASINTPSSVIPTVSMRDCRGGLLVGMKMEFMGLSAIPLPTYLLWRTTGMLWLLRWFFGPIPLSRSNWGVPIAPADTIISLSFLLFRNAWWCLPFSSVNWTPMALGFRRPASEMMFLRMVRIDCSFYSFYSLYFNNSTAL